METKQTATQWIERTARVSRACRGWGFAKSCGRTISPGEWFLQSKFRAGLERAEICIECGALAKAGIAQPSFAGFAAWPLSVPETKPAGVDTAKVDDLPGKDRR